MTLIDALNTPHLREQIEAIDDIWSSLDRGEREEPVLDELLSHAVFRLRAFGVEYDPRR